MATQTIEPGEFLELRKKFPLIDVRAPIEFEQGHVAGALNVPLFDDRERAEVGKAYKQKGRSQAIRLGLELIGPKMRSIVEEVDRICEDSEQGAGPAGSAIGEVLVYCARGGMRSDSVCWLLEQADLKTHRLRDGYKGFRQYCHSWMEKHWDLVVLTGMTGAGKTRLLEQLAAGGEQVVDLEGLAHHRGSAFGGIGQPVQPSTEQFENRIFEALSVCDPTKRIWVEDESRSVGKCVIPGAFFEQLHAAPALLIDVEVDERAEFLVAEYGALPIEEMIAAMERIRKRLGGQHRQEAEVALRAGNLKRCAEILLVYYDKTYDICREKNPRDQILEVPLSGYAWSERAAIVREAADRFANQKPAPV